MQRGATRMEYPCPQSKVYNNNVDDKNNDNDNNKNINDK